MLGTDFVRAANYWNHDVVGLDAAPSSTSPTQRPSGGRASSAAAGRRRELRRLHRRGRRRGRTSRPPRASTSTARGSWRSARPRWAPASSTRPPTTCSTARRARRTSSPTDPRRSRSTGRRRRRARPRRRRRTSATSSSAARGSSAPRAGTSSRRCSRSASDQGDVVVVRDQVGCPTYTAHLADALVRLVGTTAFGIHHIAGGGECSWYEFAAGDLPPERARGPDDVDDDRRAQPAGAAARRTRCSRPSATRRSTCRTGRRASPRTWPSGSRPSRREDARHGRRRLHRLGLRAHRCSSARPDAEVVVLDKLTYAGRRENLADVEDRIEFVHGAIEDPAAVRGAMEGCDLVVNFAAESHVDRSIAGQDPFARHARDRHGRPARRGARARRRTLPPGLDRRGLRVDRVGLVHRGLAARAVVAVLGHQGGRRPARAGARRTRTGSRR